MELKNIGKIDYDNENFDQRNMGQPPMNPHTPNNVWALRSPRGSPTDFRQKRLTGCYGRDFIDKCEKVLEIGFGCGRNAQFFVNEPHIKYYGFDTSKVGLKYFQAQKFPEDRFYASNDIDKTILSQEYDLIFSTYVLQHIGFSSNLEVYDANRITTTLAPLLKKGGYWMSHEGVTGDNGWSCAAWMQHCFDDKTFNRLYLKADILEGSVTEAACHNLIIYRKLDV